METDHKQLADLKQQAQTFLEQNELEKARDLFLEICRLDSNNANAWNILAGLNGKVGRYEEAEQNCRRAIDLDPGYADAYFNLAMASAMNGRQQIALNALEKCVSLNPGDVTANTMLGDYLKRYKDHDRAAHHYQQALKHQPEDIELQLKYAACLLKDKQNPHRTEENFQITRNIYTAILEKHPDNIKARIALATVLEKSGQREDACEIIRQLLETHGPETDILAAYARHCKHLGSCDQTIDMIRQRLDSDACDQNQKMTLLFTLGKLYDSGGQYSDAFKAYEAANQLQSRGATVSNADKLQDQLVTAFSLENVQHMKRARNNSTLPVFILGMPRSGTTLVEQILSRHSEVYAAGEIRDIGRIVDSLSDNSTPYPQNISLLTQEKIDQLAQQYLDRISSFAPDAGIVTNKTPTNFLHIGLINMLFPKARVINCVRDPVDTCLSCYFQTFRLDSYNKDLQSIARFYNNYQRLMRHWKHVIDIPMLDIHYEDLVTEPQQHVHDLLTFCGLEWDDRCLEFHRGSRVVKTASVDQVSQPMYKTSLQRWRNYMDFIGPLVSTLELEDSTIYMQ